MSDESAFTAALDIRDPVARAAYLDAACPDPDQRRRVEELILARDTTELTGAGTVAQLSPPTPARFRAAPNRVPVSGPSCKITSPHGPTPRTLPRSFRGLGLS